MQKSNVDWTKIAVFFIIACAWSWPFFWMRDMNPEAWNALPLPDPLKNTFLMWGPGIAALICFRMYRDRHTRTVTWTGGSLGRSLAFYLLPVVVLVALLAIDRPELIGAGMALMVLAIVCIGFLNILGEELGWRGFLQDALASLPKSVKYLAIGCLWTSWHFTNIFARRDGMETLTYLGWYFPLTVLLSAVIGEATDRSKSLVVPVTLHAWVNLLFEFPSMQANVVFALSILFWGWLLYRWPRQASTA